MRRIKCVVSYDGTNFHGYQVQRKGRTVQGEIEAVLQKMHKGEHIRIHSSGRTDAGVHAKGQVFHFDSSLSLEGESWKKALNAQLPDDIFIISSEQVEPTFHARFSSVEKEYHYYVLNSKDNDPFLRNYMYHFPYPLNINDMKRAMEYFIGSFDFTSFCSAKTEIEDRTRTVKDFQLTKTENMLLFKVRGNGFLYNMVRIMIGTVLEVGIGKRKPEDIITILEGQDRTLAGKTAPSHGLYLWKVYY